LPEASGEASGIAEAASRNTRHGTAHPFIEHLLDANRNGFQRRLQTTEIVGGEGSEETVLGPSILRWRSQWREGFEELRAKHVFPELPQLPRSAETSRSPHDRPSAMTG
jgi:hypothetical protein